MDCLKKILFGCFIFVCTFNCRAQKQFEFGFITENDLYTSTTLDRYYTNGLFIFLRHTSDIKRWSFDKKTRTYSVNQWIYNPIRVNIPNVAQQDRPYAGLLTTSFKEAYFSTKKSISWGIDLGLTGPSSAAEWGQNFIHNLYNIQEADGWDTQVRENIQIGISGEAIFSVKTPPSRFDVFHHYQVKLGTLVKSVQAGICGRFNLSSSPSNSLNNTSLFNSNLSPKRKDYSSEFFISLQPSISYTLEDYTVTGPLRENPVNREFSIQPIHFQTRLGIHKTWNRFNASYQIIWYSKTVQEMLDSWNRYGAIRLSYKW